MAFSTEHDLAPQLVMMEKDLRAVDRAITPWVVAFGHRPLYCSTNDYYDCKVAGPTILGPQLEPLLERYKVDLALFGHLHNYERTWPVFNGTVTAKSYTKPAGTVHAVVGMAGDVEQLTHTFTQVRQRVATPLKRGESGAQMSPVCVRERERERMGRRAKVA